MSLSVSIALSTLFLTWNTFLPLTVQASKSHPLNAGCASIHKFRSYRVFLSFSLAPGHLESTTNKTD